LKYTIDTQLSGPQVSGLSVDCSIRVFC